MDANSKIPSNQGSKIAFFMFCLAIISTLLAIFFGVKSCRDGQLINEKQDAMLELQRKYDLSQQELLQLSQENKQALDSLMESINRSQSGALSQSYPSGYRLFANTDKLFVPGPIEGIKDYDIKWDTVKVVGMTANSIQVQLPDMVYIPRQISTSRISISVPRNSRDPYLSPINVFPDRVYVQIIQDTGDAIVFAIGLMPEDTQPKSK